MNEIITLFLLTILQNASFTLTSRARNSGSLWYNGLASIASNGIWLLVIKKVVTNLDSTVLMLTYLAGSVIGSLTMHYVAMRFIENRKNIKKQHNMKKLLIVIAIGLTAISCSIENGPESPKIQVEVHFINGKVDTLTIHNRYMINRDNQLGTSECENCGYTSTANQVMYVKEL